MAFRSSSVFALALTSHAALACSDNGAKGATSNGSSSSDGVSSGGVTMTSAASGAAPSSAAGGAAASTGGSLTLSASTDSASSMGGGSKSTGQSTTGTEAGASNTGQGGAAAGGVGGTDSSAPGAGIGIVGPDVYLDGELFHVRGVNWNPVPKGANHPEGLDYAGFADQDIALMKAAGVNAVRTYEHLDDHAVLDKLYAAGIYVFSTVYAWWQDDPNVVTARVNAVKAHPAIFAWVIGNEWNYNHLYGHDNLTLEQTRDQLNQAAALIKAADTEHPVSTIYGELGNPEEGTQIEAMLDTMPDIDIWGINAYRGMDHAALFGEWAQRSNKPMYLGEYGADAWDSRDAGQLNVQAQAEAVAALTQQIIDNYTDGNAGISLGGFVFEWADEWWKDTSGSLDVQDSGGIAPGGGPHPDGVFNEEYWGIVDIDRNPRPAYDALKALYAP